MTLSYFNQALQNPIENRELLLQEGLELPKPYSVEFDLDALLRMDSKSQMAMAKDGVAGSIFSSNEARAIFNRKPKPGGDSPMAQNQMYSLEALNKRDAAAPAPSSLAPPPSAPPEPAPKGLELDSAELLDLVTKGLQVAA
jgi:phage portal protein BeeE